METNIAVGIDPSGAKSGAKAIVASLDKVENSVESAINDIDKIGPRTKKSAKQAARSVGTLTTKVKGLGSALGSFKGLAIFAGVALGAREAILATARFSSSISDLSAITGATGEDLAFFTEQAKELGRTSTLSASQAAEAFKLVASAKPDLLDNAAALAEVTKEVVALAEASGQTLPEAAVALGASLNQFSVDADQAGRFINVLAAGAKFGASEIGFTAQALQDAGTVAAQAGLSFEETNAAIQAMAAVSLKGSKAGVGLRAVILKLSTQTKDEFNPEIVGFTQAIKNLGEANLTTTQKQKLFGQESIVAANALIKQADGLSILTEKLTGTNTAYEQAAIRVNNLDGSFKQLSSATEGLLISIGEGLEPSLRSLTGTITGFFNSLEDAGKASRLFDDQIEKNRLLIKSYGIDLRNIDPENLENVTRVITAMTLQGRNLKEEQPFSLLREKLSELLLEADTVKGRFDQASSTINGNAQAAEILGGNYNRLQNEIKLTSEALRDLGTAQNTVQPEIKAPTISAAKTVITKVDIEGFKRGLLSQEELLVSHFEKQKEIANRAFDTSLAGNQAKNDAIFTITADHLQALRDLDREELGTDDTLLKLDEIRSSLQTERDLLITGFNEKQFDLEDSVQRLIITEQEKNDLIQQLRRNHIAALAEIDSQELSVGGDLDKIESIRQSLLSEREVLDEHLIIREGQIEDSFQDGLISLALRKSLLIGIEEKHQNDITKILKKATDDRTRFERLSVEQQAFSTLNTTATLAGLLARNADKNNKKSFEKSKKLSLAAAAANAPGAIIRGYNDGGAYGAAIAAVAVGLQIDKINSSSYGGGSSSVSPPSAGSGEGDVNTPTAPITPIQPIQQDQTQAPVQVIINGNVYGVDDLNEFVEEALKSASSSDRITVTVVDSGERVKIA